MENVRSHPRFVVKFGFIICLNLFALWFLKERLGIPLRIGEVTLILISSFIVSKCFFSIIISPSQFFTALVERIGRFFGLIGILFVRLYGVMMALAYRFSRVVIRILIIIIYGVSPIDIIPDIILGPGQVDDLLVTFFLGWWVLADLREHVSKKTRELVIKIDSKTRPKTKFP